MGFFLIKSKKDRRYYEHRRKSPYDLDYFLKGGRERRNGKMDRRMTPEFREDWRVNRMRNNASILNILVSLGT